MLRRVNRVLIANRGEIALRIIKACRNTGKTSILAYSKADRNTIPVEEADESICIGPPPAQQSYLSIPALLTAARLTMADGIHPGYGFLSENGTFARLCEERGLIFIGPRAETIWEMGDKARARSLMKSVGVPVIPGSDGIIHSEEEGIAAARRIGYPVLIKASAGGGGKGMREADDEEELKKNMKEASTEALKAFGNGDIYLERFFRKVHHVEVQIMADREGHVAALGERDCSSQRNHQKMIEESPSPIMDETLRQKMEEAAKKAARASNYVGAGTVEFIVTPDRDFYFMEMNTRIQVEHGVTEEATGTELVETMIRIADGESLPWKEDLTPQGWTMECRINAENPFRGFAPSPGRLLTFEVPKGEGIRVDTAMRRGAEISPFYDSMIAKLIVHDDTREKTRKKMKEALSAFHIKGVSTNIPLQKAIISSKAFAEGEVDTTYVERHLKEFLQSAENG
ncbi:acetyl-CoA carboxylase biotin carboxylase subunit [uncultured Dialister sp.]|uniref:acetyl-CoA carboxylase biotin carboxylase subunit n=1 Tax=uncultured Dialister sp. TaxID=278064 RepID=UPI002608E02F|nr:acetyl-CoA carboxylase biotin carboxylase subunit [uncultured Dialister sp.]